MANTGGVMINFIHKIKSYLFLIFLLIFLISTSDKAFADCSVSASEAYDGYRDAKRAYRASDLDDCHRYAKKAYRHFSYAEDEAISCGCSYAESEAYDGYRDAKRAYRADDLESCHSYARKAYKHGSYAEDEANGC